MAGGKSLLQPTWRIRILNLGKKIRCKLTMLPKLHKIGYFYEEVLQNRRYKVRGLVISHGYIVISHQTEYIFTFPVQNKAYVYSIDCFVFRYQSKRSS